MELDAALDFARAHRHGVLVTRRRSGLPQLSNVMYHVGGDGLFRISITATRAKYHNLRRDPWAALHVTQQDFYAYVVLEGEVELTPPAAAVDDATVDELVWHYEQVAGEHHNWDEFRQAMVDEQRVVARFRSTRGYGMLALPT
jgi:PPOX class probable F420-dependent enzyme